jgi:D-alanyl-D-alanine carboxypeptidase
MKFFL